MSLSPEFLLAVECCRRNFRGGGSEMPFAPVDWQRFSSVAEFHRIEGLVWKSLNQSELDVPTSVTTQIAESAQRIASDNLVATAATATLQTSFERAGVPVVFLKGLTVGSLAYGTSALKSAIDIDLLIDPADLGRAARLLRVAGYSLQAPDESADDRVLHKWHRTRKESVWRCSATQLQVDLHTRAADNPTLIPSIDVHSRRQLVDVGNGVRLSTFAQDELFAYLAVHGASSCWFRLKWIADFAALLSGRSGQDIEHLYDRSQKFGAGRAAGQALLLADTLFTSLADCPSLAQRLRTDRATQRLAEIALTLMSASREPTEHRFGTLPIHVTQFRLQTGVAYKLSELRRQAEGLLTRSGG